MTTLAINFRPWRLIWCALVIVAGLVLVHFAHPYWGLGVVAGGLGIDAKQ